MDDVDNEYVHKVPVAMLQDFVDFKLDEVRSFCGKIWTPTITGDFRKDEKPRCPQCFRASTPYSMSA